jgi:hypothetical protein
MVILLYCVVNGTLILNIFNPNGQGVMQSYQANPSVERKELEAVLTGQDNRNNNAVTSQPASTLNTTETTG